MNPTFWDRLDLFARALLPFLITVTLIVAGMVPLPASAASGVWPALPLVAVYYWCVHKPELMPIWIVFVLGLIQDVLSGGLIGVHAISLLCVYAFISWQRRVFTGAPFTLVWCVFIVVAGVALTLEWLLHCLGLFVFLDPRPAFFQYLLTVAAYPAFAWIAVQVGRLMQRR